MEQLEMQLFNYMGVKLPNVVRIFNTVALLMPAANYFWYPPLAEFRMYEAVASSFVPA